MEQGFFRSRLFRFAGLRGRALSRGGRSALPRLRLGYGAIRQSLAVLRQTDRREASANARRPRGRARAGPEAQPRE